jgi:hypothetical protein
LELPFLFFNFAFKLILEYKKMKKVLSLTLIILFAGCMVSAQNAYDIAGVDIELSPYTQIGTISIIGEVQNNGDSIITFLDLNYSINGIDTVTSHITGLFMPYANPYYYTAPIPWVPTTDGVYTIKVWMTNLNGHADQDTSNDAISMKISIYTNPIQRTVLVEEFSNASCPPCEIYDTTYTDSLMNLSINQSECINVRYHTSWPGYDSINLFNPIDISKRVTFYHIVGTPTAVVDGIEPVDLYNFGNPGYPTNVRQTLIDSDYAYPAQYEIIGTAYFNSTTSDTMTISGSVTAKAYPIYPASLYVVLTETIINNNEGGCCGERNFYSAVRKMFPDGNGTYIGLDTEGHTTDFNFNYVIPSFFNKSRLHLAIFVQDTSKYVYQAYGTIAGYTGIPSLNIESSSVSIYPNPATTLLHIHQSIPSPNQQLIITDLLGTEVYKEMLTGIDNTISISTWSAGIYFYEVRVMEGTVRGKFVKVN